MMALAVLLMFFSLCLWAAQLFVATMLGGFLLWGLGHADDWKMQ